MQAIQGMLLAVAILIGIGSFLDSSLIPSQADFASYFLTLRVHLRELVHSGSLYWNDASLTGAAGWANPQYGFFYPPAWSALFLSAQLSLKWDLFFHWGAFLGGAVYLARTMGVSWGLALPLAVILSFRGIFLSVATMLQNFQTMAWLPWLVALLAKSPTRRSKVCFAGFSYLFFAAGEPQAALILGGLLILTLLVKRAWSLLGIFLASCLIQPWLFPFLFEVATGDRAHGLRSMTNAPWATTWDLVRSVWSPWSVLCEDMWGWWEGTAAAGLRPNWIQNLYMGLFSLPLVLLGWWNSGRLRIPLAVLCASFLILSLGSTIGAVGQWIHSLPILSMIRFPVRYLLGIDAMIVVLALWGARILSKSHSSEWFGKSALAFALLGLGILLVRQPGSVEEDTLLARSIGALCIGIAPLALFYRRPGFLAFLLPLLLSLDAVWVAMSNSPQWGFKPRNHSVFPAVVEQIENRSGRWFVYNRHLLTDSVPGKDSSYARANWATQLMAIDVGGDVNISPGGLAANGLNVISEALVLRPPRSTYLQSLAVKEHGARLKKILWLLGVNHVLSEVLKDGTVTHPINGVALRTPIVTSSLFGIRDVSGAPRIYLADSIATTRTWNGVLEDSTTSTVYVGIGDAPPGRTRGSIEVIDSSGQTLSVKLNDVTGVVAFRQEYRDGWVARLDGEVLPILTPNLFHSGVHVQARSGILEMVYVPPGLRFQIAASLLAMIAIMVLVYRQGRTRLEMDRTAACGSGVGRSSHPTSQDSSGDGRGT